VIDVTAVVEQTAQFGIPIKAVEPPDGVAAVVPVHEKQVVPAKTYPEAQAVAETAADEIVHVVAPVVYPVIPVVAPEVGNAHGTQILLAA